MSFGSGAGPGSRGDGPPTHGELQSSVDRAIPTLMYRFGKRRVPEFVVGSVAGLASRGLSLLPSFFLAIAIDSLFFDERAFALPLVPGAWLPGDRAGQLGLLLGIVGVTYVLQAVLGWVNSWAWNHFAQHLQHEVRVETYDTMQALEMEFYDDRRTGEIMSILNNDVNQLESFLTQNLNTAIRVFVALFGTFLVMVLVNWQLTLVTVTVLPVLAGMSLLFARIVGPKYHRVRASVGHLNSRLENNVAGIEVVKSFTNESFEARRVEDASEEYRDAQWDAITTRIKFFPALEFVTGLGYLLTLGIGGWWVMFGPPGPFTASLTPGVLVMFLTYTRQFMFPMVQFGQILNSYQYAEAAGQRILGLVEDPATITERRGGDDIGDVEGHVEYDDVAFGYGDGDDDGALADGGGTAHGEGSGVAGGDHSDGADGNDDTVLTGVSFDVDPGDHVGVVGPTGAGKTTLVKLLLRFYDVDSGAIRVDGQDIRDVSVESLRDAVGYVSQDPYLFDGTVRENIAYGEADVDDTAIERAARLAGAHRFVAELPKGYDTRVGERGIKLSGGQRQRISIARAVLKDPEILILDEATSHVDNETEVLIRDRLEELVADRTTFAIAHRLSTVRDADTILVMEDGELVEEGTHEQLLDEDGLYANLWRVQVGEIQSLPEEFVERAAEREEAPTGADSGGEPPGGPGPGPW